jgi:hypothetical protein|tara:strand:- start:62 stop:421 length:360 start_codon:yes stop_codon:yes gene_type:complete
VDRLDGVKKAGTNSVRANCPNCKGTSFYATIGSKKIMLYCHAGCEYADLADSLQLKKADLYIKNDFQKTKDWRYWKERGPIDKEIIWLKSQWQKQGQKFSDADIKVFSEAETRLKKYRR